MISAVLLSPLLFLLYCTPFLRRSSINILLFIALVKQNKSLFTMRRNFIEYYFKEAKAMAFVEGLEELRYHQALGREVVILSASPAWLVKGIIRYMGLSDIKVVGSKLVMRFSSLQISQYCYAKNKLKMAEESGLDCSTWSHGYSDSPADIPVLKACGKRVLINVSSKTLGVFKRHLTTETNALVWNGKHYYLRYADMHPS
jgi:phosphoserine phosphatase